MLCVMRYMLCVISTYLIVDVLNHLQLFCLDQLSQPCVWVDVEVVHWKFKNQLNIHTSSFVYCHCQYLRTCPSVDSV